MVVESILELLSNHRREPGPGETINNGLICCSRCGEPKQFIIPEFGYCVPVQCRCEREQYDTERRKIKAEDEERRRRLCHEGIKGRKYQSMTFDRSDADLPWAKRYTENFEKYKREGLGLLLTGDKGTGKTYAAACIANALADRGYKVLMADLPYYLSKLSGFDTTGALEDLKRYSLLVLDDFGSDRKSGYTCERIYSLINSRSVSGLPMIVTTNVSLQEMRDCDDISLARSYDRLKEMCHVVQMRGESRRSAIANQRYRSAKEELGI